MDVPVGSGASQEVAKRRSQALTSLRAASCTWVFNAARHTWVFARHTWVFARPARPCLGRAGRAKTQVYLATLGLLMHGFRAGRTSPIVWGLGGPGSPTNHSRRWGASPTDLLECCFWPPGPPEPQTIGVFRPARKPCIQNPSVPPSNPNEFIGVGAMDGPKS
jgi:hypothetical protein